MLRLCAASLLAACVGKVGPGLDPPSDTPAPAPLEPAETRPTSAPAGQPAVPATTAPSGCAVPAAGLWKLSPLQYERTVAALVPRAPALGARLRASLPPPSAVFTNESQRLELTEPHTGALVAAAEELARTAVGTVPAAVTCLGGKVDLVPCVRGFVREFGARAFRRPLGVDEEERYHRFFVSESAASDPRAALSLLVQAFLLSPHFLFRSELGEAGALTPWERASALSYLLTDGPPDAELSAAARAGTLADRDEVLRHAQRLLLRPEGAPAVARLFAEQMGYGAADTVERDARRFPTFAAARSYLTRETAMFVEQALWREDGKLSTLLAGRFSMLNQPLAAHYGVSGIVGNELRRVDLSGARRAGLLTQASWLALHARADEPDIVSRGRFVRERLLCEEVPPPPPDANAVPPPADRALTHRQRIERHSKDPACSGCHRLLDSLGIAFEGYDADGRLRSTEGTMPIDPSGRAPVAGGGDLVFADGVELAEGLARHPAVASCFVRQAFQFAHGRAPVAADACALEALGRAFTASGGDVRRLIAEVATHDSFLLRRNP